MIYPAIDLQNGSSVRLYQGDFKQETLVSADPIRQARLIREAGIGGLHLVDLDGAKTGQPQNFELVSQIVKVFAGETEIGGGIRNEQTIRRYLKSGVDRVILGSVALKDPKFTKQMLEKFGSRAITIGVDGRNGQVATDGWLNQSTTSMADLIAVMTDAGAKRFIVTDTATDGTLTGPNIELLEGLQQKFPEVRIVASGGVGSLDDLKKLKQAGLKDVIVGKAIAAGKVTLEQIAEVNEDAG